MDLLNVVRVFPLEHYIHTLPYWIGSRLVMVACLYGIVWAATYATRPWTRATRTLALTLLKNRIAMKSDDMVKNFAYPRLMINAGFALLAGAIYDTAWQIYPDDFAFHAAHGIASLRELGPAGWMIVGSVAIIGWTSLFHVTCGTRMVGLIAGIVDAIPYILMAGTWFFLGLVLGPAAVIFFMLPRFWRSYPGWIWLFLSVPVKILFGIRDTSFSASPFQAISNAMKKAGGD